MIFDTWGGAIAYEDDEPFSRRITIELESGDEIELDLYAASGESLDLFQEEEEDEEEEDDDDDLPDLVDENGNPHTDW